VNSEAVAKLQAAQTSLKGFLTGSVESFFDDFSPVILQKTLSHADGNFSLSYRRKGGLTIFAKTQRAAVDAYSMESQEKYYWLVNAPATGETAQLLLSNSKLIPADPDGYLESKQSAE
jgi:hypothetical protein